MDRDEQIQALAKALAMTVPPSKLVAAQWAQVLVDKFGVRVYAELNTIGDKPVQVNRANLLQVLKDMGSPLADRVAAAVTDEDKAALMEEIAEKHPEQIAEMKSRIEALA